jgi:hypothetical protein
VYEEGDGRRGARDRVLRNVALNGSDGCAAAVRAAQPIPHRRDQHQRLFT